ncbi:hypothetical protein [Mesorhizobium dulcispinae]|uniref:hypothetical protein n=1 Tax=Mesorhizobium dulcispinae TaxID=3072316 RepID=UPI002A2458F4|nr:hypothetical protein [Mesorhizobium sp. VK23D]MDX8521880.1 hypothetical protein [Mesorhizobium sp. VK23D]
MGRAWRLPLEVPKEGDVHNKNAATAKPGGVEFHTRQRHQMPSAMAVSGNEAEASGGHGAGLTGHGLGKALTLESGRQVHFAAGEKAGKQLHHHLHLVAQTGRLRLMEWGSSFWLAVI